MSWSLFQTKCMVLTGPTHVSMTQFAQTIANGYHEAVSLHFELMTGGGKILNNAPKLPILYQGILGVCTANLQTHQGVQFLQQIGPHILTYHTANIIQGPLGFINVLSPGVWSGLPVPPNTNFNILLQMMITCFRTHIISLAGTYTSTVLPGVVSPWSGASLVSLP